MDKHIETLEAIVRDMMDEAAHSGEKDAIAMRAWATRVDAAIALMRGQSDMVLVPRELPFSKQFIAKGVRTENGVASTVYLYFSDEGGGWYQWSTSKAWAKAFNTEKAALAAAKSAPGPWFLMPEKSTITCEQVESQKAKKYRAMIESVTAAKEDPADE